MFIFFVTTTLCLATLAQVEAQIEFKELSLGTSSKTSTENENSGQRTRPSNSFSDLKEEFKEVDKNNDWNMSTFTQAPLSNGLNDNAGKFKPSVSFDNSTFKENKSFEKKRKSQSKKQTEETPHEKKTRLGSIAGLFILVGMLITIFAPIVLLKKRRIEEEYY